MAKRSAILTAASWISQMPGVSPDIADEVVETDAASAARRAAPAIRAVVQGVRGVPTVQRFGALARRDHVGARQCRGLHVQRLREAGGGVFTAALAS